MSTFVVYDEGPWGLGRRLRAGLVRIGLGALVSCVHCLSVWVALGVTATLRTDMSIWLLSWGAVAGLTSALELWLAGAREWHADSGEELDP